MSNLNFLKNPELFLGNIKAIWPINLLHSLKKNLELTKKPNHAKPSLNVKGIVMRNFSFCYTWLYLGSLIFTG